MFITSLDRDWNASHGTGVVVNARLGYIVTAYHVIGPHNLVAASPPLADGDGNLVTDTSRYSSLSDASLCVVVACDPKRDLAIIRFKQPRGLQAMPLAQASRRRGRRCSPSATIPRRACSISRRAMSGRCITAHYRFDNGQQITARVTEMST